MSEVEELKQVVRCLIKMLYTQNPWSKQGAREMLKYMQDEGAVNYVKELEIELDIFIKDYYK